MGKLSIEELEQRILNRFPKEKFNILKYEGMTKPGTIKCLNCGKEIQINRFSNFFARNKVNGCLCRSELKRDREKIIEMIKEQYDIVSTSVKETHTYYKVKCKKCSHIRTGTLSNFKRFFECGCKTGVYRNRTPQEFINEVNNYSNIGKYELVGDYINQTTKVLLRHECGLIFNVKPSDIIHGRSQCPKCRTKMSRGAREVEKSLIKRNINYYCEFPLEGSRQRFDFYFELNGAKIAIEYNGEQHYKEITFFNNDLAYYQNNDNRKKQYCIEHNINLFVIPYTVNFQDIDNEIEKIINKFNDQSL